jgi:hypothetical protein
MIRSLSLYSFFKFCLANSYVSNNNTTTFVLTDVKHNVFTVVFWFQFQLNYWTVT